MGQRTEIQWCDSTVNPNTGCDGCELWELVGPRMPPERVARLRRSCYAGALHEGRLARSLPGLYGPEFTDVRMVPGRMAKAAAWPDLRGVPRPDKPWIPPEMPRLIFVGDMGDVFSKAVSFEFLKEELIGAADSPKGRRHLWLVLTKRPSRFAEFARWNGGLPENIWAGASVTGEKTLTRIDGLLEVPASVRFLSLEPLVERVWLPVRERTSEAEQSAIAEVIDAIGGIPDNSINARLGRYCEAVEQGIHQVIIGGESGQGAHKARSFDLAWARSLTRQCRGVDIAVFLKQLGSRPFDSFYRSGVADQSIRCRDSHGGDWDEWPADLRVREFPRAPIGA